MKFEVIVSDLSVDKHIKTKSECKKFIKQSFVVANTVELRIADTYLLGSKISKKHKNENIVIYKGDK